MLAEFGTKIPEDVEVRVSDSTAVIRYLVLPVRPAGTEHLSEDALANLVTRDAMIGVVAHPLPSGRITSMSPSEELVRRLPNDVGGLAADRVLPRRS